MKDLSKVIRINDEIPKQNNPIHSKMEIFDNERPK